MTIRLAITAALLAACAWVSLSDHAVPALFTPFDIPFRALVIVAGLSVVEAVVSRFYH